MSIRTSNKNVTFDPKLLTVLEDPGPGFGRRALVWWTGEGVEMRGEHAVGKDVEGDNDGDNERGADNEHSKNSEHGGRWWAMAKEGGSKTASFGSRVLSGTCTRRIDLVRVSTSRLMYLLTRSRTF